MNAPRVIKDSELRSARDGFKLTLFFTKASQARKDVWFRACDCVWESGRMLLDADPEPEWLVTPLTKALEDDEALGAWMDKRTNLQWRLDPSNWRLVEKATAGVIVQAYLNACENSTWTRTI